MNILKDKIPVTLQVQVCGKGCHCYFKGQVMTTQTNEDRLPFFIGDDCLIKCIMYFAHRR